MKQTRNRWKPELPVDVARTLKDLRETKGNDLHSYIVALRDKGGSLRAIANPLGVSRERVRQLSETHPFDISYSRLQTNSNGYYLPELPTKPERNRAKKEN